MITGRDEEKKLLQSLLESDKSQGYCSDCLRKCHIVDYQ